MSAFRAWHAASAPTRTPLNTPATACKAVRRPARRRRTKPADPIIVHPDVRRMLLTMKASNEGGRAFSTYVAMQLDTAKFSEDAATRKRAEDLVALLTPVAKAFLTDLGLETTDSWPAGVRRPRLHPRMGPGATGARRAHHPDLRRHQRHSGAGPGGAQGGGQLAGRSTSCSPTRFAISPPPLAPTSAEFTRPLNSALDNLDELTAWLLDRSQNQPERNRRGVGRVPARVRLHRLRLHVGTDGQGFAGQGSAGRLLRQQAGHRALLLRRLLPRIHSLSASVKAGSDSLYLLTRRSVLTP